MTPDAYRETIAGLGRLDRLFKPRSVAVIGASDNPAKFGGRPLNYLLRYGFKGAIHAVNPRATTVQGQPAHASILAIDDEIDLAIIAVPADQVAPVLAECAGAGVGGAVIFSAGFAETGETGAAMQDDLKAAAGRVRLLGPNCLGFFSVEERVGATFSTSLEPGWSAAGGLAVVSQSGAVGAHIYYMARLLGLGLNYWCATGNEVDIDTAECVAYAARQPTTKAIALYLEGARDGLRIRAALEFARQAGKPVIAIKAGTTELGIASVGSHTAALAGTAEVYRALFRQYGVHEVKRFGDMLDIIYVLDKTPPPRGRRLAVITVSGGAGILMADRAVERGLEMPPLPAPAQRRLRALVPFASPRNPIDMTAQALTDPELLSRNLAAAVEAGLYDCMIVFMTAAAMYPPVMESVHRALKATFDGPPPLPVLVSLIAPAADRARLEERGFPVFEEPLSAIDTLAALVDLVVALDRPTSMVAPSARGLDVTGWLNEGDALAALAAAGLPVIEARLARSADEAIAAAAAFGRPVALKIASPDIVHKSDIDGVRLGLAGADAIRDAYGAVIDNARRAEPAAQIDGVLVEPMESDGVETIIGVKRDPAFGPVVMFGLGGVHVEALADVAFRLAPFDVAEAHRMIDEIKGRAILGGARGRPAADIEALARALSLVSEIAAASADEVDQIDINPFLVRASGRGALALDALIVPRAAASRGSRDR